MTTEELNEHTREIKEKINKIKGNKNKVSLEKQLQKIVKIPIQDLRNMIIEKK